MVDRYPHSAVITWKQEATYDEATGTYSDGGIKTVNLSECRFEYKGNQYKPTPSGDLQGYNYIIFAPPFDDVIRDNASIHWNEESRSFIVKHVEKYNRHAKIWIDS